jgi:solute carrier family 8 (sodium/calcium exchanger)
MSFGASIVDTLSRRLGASSCSGQLICEVGGEGFVGMPWFGDGEQELWRPFRALLYLMGLGWCFMGVNMAADAFMGAIEGGEVRYIQQTKVYYVTASWSILAYFWLIVVLLIWSPHVVEPIEGVITFMFFPMLIVFAYAADRGAFSRTAADDGDGSRIVAAELTKEELAELTHQVRTIHGDVKEEQLIRIINCECQEPTSRAKYRAAAIRNMTAGKKVTVSDANTERVARESMREREAGGVGKAKSVRSSAARRSTNRRASRGLKVMPIISDDEETEQDLVDECVIEFDCKKYAVLENAGYRKVIVNRHGCLDQTATVAYKTVEGTAKATNDFTHTEGTLTFRPGEMVQSFKVFIVDDTAFEDDEEFYVELSNPTVEGGLEAKIGMNNHMTIVIIDDDDPGVMSFEQEIITIQEDVEDKTVELIVKRADGSTGKVSVQYKTEDASAKAGRDFEAQSGELVFEEGENAKAIRLLVYGRGSYARKDYLRVYLTDVTGGAKFDPKTDGGETSDIMTVFIESHAEGKEFTDRLMNNIQKSWHQSKIGHANYVEQFTAAVHVNGGEEGEEIGIQDKVLHVVTLPWKLMCAFIPPTDYCGGWMCFWVSLLVIGCVTGVISDLASLLGCVADMPDEVTAITLVALGTSLPDLFASKTAALNEPFADASVGNVTGSNCVNVFLGLGLPWTIGSIYWTVKGPDSKWEGKYQGDTDIAQHFRDSGAFIVKAGALVSSVMVFSCMAAVCLLVLYVRRRKYGGELGGPRIPAMATSALLVCLWLTYVGLSSYFALKQKADCR